MIISESFLKTVPTEPGVYRVYSGADELIYVGKGKNLRRRLSQYRNAKRRKKHAKMRAIVADAERIEFETTADNLQALLLENRLIQLHRPKWNIAGAFHFLYPLIGTYFHHGYLYICFTTSPERFPEFHFHGTYRSRSTTQEAFRSLCELLCFVSRPLPRGRIYGKDGFGKRDRFSEVQGFGGLTAEWIDQFDSFLRGEERSAMESLILTLVESAAARRATRSVQRNLNWLKYFWKHEAVRLRMIRKATGFSLYPVPQSERDRLFLEYRNRPSRGAQRLQAQTPNESDAPSLA